MVDAGSNLSRSQLNEDPVNINFNLDKYYTVFMEGFKGTSHLDIAVCPDPGSMDKLFIIPEGQIL